jgi:hypothetical protein
MLVTEEEGHTFKRKLVQEYFTLWIQGHAFLVRQKRIEVCTVKSRYGAHHKEKYNVYQEKYGTDKLWEL